MIAVWKCFAIGFWFFVFLSACGQKASTEISEVDPAWPDVLRLGYTPAEELTVDREAANRALARYLERSLGLRVELIQTATYAPAVEALAAAKIDLMHLGPFAYVLAAERGVAEPLVVLGSIASGPRTYQSALIASRASGITTVSDIVKHAKRLRFNYTDPASNSGHLVPRAKLATLGIVPERDFVQADFTRSHAVSVFNVAFGTADIAGVNNTTLQSLLAKGRIDESMITVLWTSSDLPNGPLVVRSGLPMSLTQKIRAALLDLPAKNPEASKLIMSQYREKNSVYVSCDEDLYADLYQLFRGAAITEVWVP